MNIAVVGTGYVGLVTGACFAEMGNSVTCIDVDADRIERLRLGRCPIFEIGLPEMLRRNIREERLRFTTSLKEVAETCDIFFIAVGTASTKDGSSDLTQVLKVAREIGELLQRPAVIVDKSTVPVGTGDRIESIIRAALQERNAEIEFEVVSNPEFLKEGTAVHDFMRPDRVIVGTDSTSAREIMHDLYRSFTYQTDRVLFMRRRDAEMVKYAANAMLATRISFMNEIANLCERMDVDVDTVRLGIGSDPRIGYSFLYPGCGYGGSCLPKDLKALIHMAEESGFEASLLRAVDFRNSEQKRRLNERVNEIFGAELTGRTFGVWGLSFKPGTDDVREAPSRVLLEHLIHAGAKVLAYDPEAAAAARREFPPEWFDTGALTLVDHQYDACRNVDALVLVTEWKPFRHPDFPGMKKLMKRPLILDGRNQYDPEQLGSSGFEHVGIGRGSWKSDTTT